MNHLTNTKCTMDVTTMTPTHNTGVDSNDPKAAYDVATNG